MEVGGEDEATRQVVASRRVEDVCIAEACRLSQDTCGSAFVLVAGAVAAVCLAACAAAIVASRPRVAAAQAAQGPLEAVAPLEECAALDADEDGSTAAAHTDEESLDLDVPAPPPRTVPRLFGAGLSEAERGRRKVRAILNKLTRERFYALYAQLLALCAECSDAAREELVESVANEVFDKATGQHVLIDIYADLCIQLRSDLEQLIACGAVFKRSLVARCRDAFERYLTAEQVNVELDPEEQYEEHVKHKTSMIGNALLVAHLLRRRLMHPMLMFHVTDQLAQVSTPETLETLCVFLQSLGGHFDTPTWEGFSRLEAVFALLQDVANDAATTPRIRFLINDLFDKRSAGWDTRSPKTVGAGQKAPQTSASGLAKLSNTREQPSPPQPQPSFGEGTRRVSQARRVQADSADEAEMGQQKPHTTWAEDFSPALSTASTEAGLMPQTPASYSGGGRSRRVEAVLGRSTGQAAQGNRTSKRSCRIPVMIDPEDDFKVVKRLIGQRGANMKAIVAKVPDVKIRIRGRGSGFLEGLAKKETAEPLVICVTAGTPETCESAVMLLDGLLRVVYSEYGRECRRRGVAVPNLDICPY